MTRKILLVCGVLSSLLYVAMTVFIAMQWEGYSSASQTISELSAIGAPTRSLWVLPGAFYTVLVTAFGWGVWKSAGRNRALRIVGGLIVAYGTLGLAWPFAPMHLREALAAGGGTLSDTMHIVLAGVTVPLMLLAIGFGAGAFGKRFRLYSIASLVILAAFGALTFLDAPRHSGQSTYAVDRGVGAHQPRCVPALGSAAGHYPLARPGHRGRDRSTGYVCRMTKP